MRICKCSDFFFKVIPLKPLQIQVPIISSMESDQTKSQRQISPSRKLITIVVFAPYCRAYRASLVIPLFTYLWTFEIICDLANNKYYYCTAKESIINLQDENHRLQEQILLVWLAQMESIWLSEWECTQKWPVLPSETISTQETASDSTDMILNLLQFCTLKFCIFGLFFCP